MSDAWIRGRFEGSFEGLASSARGSEAEGQRYRIQLRGGLLSQVEAASAPAPLDLAQQRALRQAVVRHVRVVAVDHPPGEITLYDARLDGLRMHAPLDASGRAYGRISGTLLARLSPPERVATGLSEPVLLTKGSSTADGSAANASVAVELNLAGAAASGAGAEGATVELSSAAVAADVQAATPADDDTPLPEPDTLDPAWYVVFLWLAWVGLALGLARGPLAVALWCAVLAVSVGVRRLMRRFVVRNGPVQQTLGVVVVLAQLVPLLGPLDVAYKLRCLPALGPWIVVVAGAVMLAAALRGRAPVILAGLIWTSTLFAWGSTPHGTCASGTTLQHGFLLPGQSVATPRVDASGRWPRTPGAPDTNAGTEP